MNELKQPDRLPKDGRVAVNIDGEDHVVVIVDSGLGEQTIRMSKFNAWRLFGILAFLLKIPLSKSVMKKIKL